MRNHTQRLKLRVQNILFRFFFSCTTLPISIANQCALSLRQALPPILLAQPGEKQLIGDPTLVVTDHEPDASGSLHPHKFTQTRV